MDDFWDKLTHLVYTSQLVIDRPKGSHHPRFEDIIYPLDYGYLSGTTSADGDGIDIWRGTQNDELQVVGALITVDTMKRDVEIKLLLNCTPEEIQTVVEFTHDNQMGGYLLTP